MTETIAGVHTARQPGLGTTLLIIAAVVLIRLLGVILTPLNLGPDEAQYWRWGQSFDWGYWSKPPLIGWVIGATTSLFGDAEWAVRLAAPLTHGFGAVMLPLLGRAMFGIGVGTAAALIYLLMPGVTLSSAIISTDGLLLPLWAAGLFMLWRLRSGEGGLWSAAGLGAAIGVGFLAKYAMVYFLVGLGLLLLTDRPTRRARPARRAPEPEEPADRHRLKLGFDLFLLVAVPLPRRLDRRLRCSQLPEGVPVGSAGDRHSRTCPGPPAHCGDPPVPAAALR